MKTIVGLYDSYADAQNAAQELVNAGVDRNNISVVANNETEQHGARESATTVGSDNSMAGAALHDAEVGAGIGGVLGFLAGASLLVVPGLGFIAGAGWLAGLLTGAAIGGVAGGLVGALSHVGVPEEDATYYNEGVRRGGTLVAVKAQDAEAQRVADILGNHSAVNIDERASQYRQEGFLPTPNYNASTATAAAATPAVASTLSADRDIASAPVTNLATTAVNTTPVSTTNTNVNTNLNTTSLPTTVNAGQEVAIPIIEEELQVGKRQMQGGGARIHTFVEERPVSEQVSLHEEHVTVDRHPVNRELSQVDMQNALQEGTIEVTEMREVPVVSKEARVVEEVVVGKQASDRMETVSDTVRRTDVEVEQLPTAMTQVGGTTMTGSTTTGTVAGVEHTARTVAEGNVPGVQTGGHAVDGSGAPDTRGITEKVADTVTGNRIDDKTGRPV